MQAQVHVALSCTAGGAGDPSCVVLPGRTPGDCGQVRGAGWAALAVLLLGDTVSPGNAFVSDSEFGSTRGWGGDTATPRFRREPRLASQH